MLLSIAVYFGLALMLFAMSKHALSPGGAIATHVGKGRARWEYVVAVLCFAVIAGARYHTGYDHAAYLTQYLTYQKYLFFTRDFEPGFELLTRIVASTGAHFFFYFAILALVEMTMLCYAVSRQNAKLLSWVMLLMMLGPTFVHLMNTVRQGMVECAVPLLIYLMYDKKTTQAVILILILASLHYTALLLLVLLPFRPGNIKLGRTVMLVSFVLAVALGAYPIWMPYLLSVVKSAAMLFPSTYDGLLDGLMSQGNIVFGHFGPIRLVLLVSQFITIWFAKDVLSQYSWHRGLAMIALLAMVFVIGTNLFSTTTCFLQRPFELFSICYLMMAAYAILYLIEAGNRGWAAVALIVNGAYIFLALLKAHLTPDPVTVPCLYHFFFGN